MKVKCGVCFLECEEDLKKCPRCGSILTSVMSCQNCNGCSIWKKCKIKKDEEKKTQND